MRRSRDRGWLGGQSADEPEVQVSEDDPSAVLLASSTTGFPEGCLATQADLGLSFGDVGEIICQSPLAAHGYYKNPGATTVSFGAGWFYTGDLGYFDEEGFLFVLGSQERYG